MPTAALKSRAVATTAHGATLGGVPARYTWEQIKSTVAEWRAAGASLRGIARKLNQRAGPGKVVITHRVVQRILAGYEPHAPAIRAALDLPPYVAVAACAVCGGVHVRATCPNKPKPARQPRYRPTVREVRGYAALLLALLVTR